MPRVALTQSQREDNAINDLSKSILDRLNEKRGRERKNNTDFAKEIGISRAAWYVWNDRGVQVAEFGTVVRAAMRAGLTIEVKA